MSIITLEAYERCAREAERREHLRAVCALEVALATKRIKDYYARLEANEWHPQLDRRVHDAAMRRSTIVTQRPSDMSDIDLHLSAEPCGDAIRGDQ